MLTFTVARGRLSYGVAVARNRVYVTALYFYESQAWNVLESVVELSERGYWLGWDDSENQFIDTLYKNDYWLDVSEKQMGHKLLTEVN